MGNTHSDTSAFHDALSGENLPARATRWESSYIGPNLSSLLEAAKTNPIVAPTHIPLRQIYETAFLLRHLTLPELVPHILYYAEMFEPQVFVVDEVEQVSGVGSVGGAGWGLSRKYDCLVSEPIRSSARIKCPVRRVIFEIESRETVWERRDGSCCWTRFTAGILPPPEDLESEEEVVVGDEGLGNVVKGDETLLLMNEREIGRHDSALREIKTYRLQWTADSDDPEEARWVKSLANGDRLVVRASALYPGFVNKIHTVRVALYMGAIV